MAYVSLIKNVYVNVKLNDGSVLIGFVVGDNQSGLMLESTDIKSPRHLFIPWGNIQMVMPDM